MIDLFSNNYKLIVFIKNPPEIQIILVIMLTIKYNLLKINY